MRVDSLGDTLSREGLLAESALDVIEHFRMRRIGLVQNVAQCEVRGPEAVTEVLGKDPTTVYKNRSLRTVCKFAQQSLTHRHR